MIFNKLNSKAQLIKQIPWNKEIEISQIVFNESDFNKFSEMYLKEKTSVQKEQIINSFLIKQTVFAKAFEVIVDCYKFRIDEDDFKMIKQFEINKYNFDENNQSNKKQQFIQSKINKVEFDFNKNKDIILKRNLIFIDLAKTNKITISESELNEYKKWLKQNKFFDDSQMNDDQKIYWMMFESKMQAFIINKFKFNIEKLKTNIEYDYKHIYKNIEKIENFAKSLVSKKLANDPKI